MAVNGKNRSADSKSIEADSLQHSEENVVMEEIGRIFNSSLVIDEVFEQIGSQIQRLISFDRIRINVFDRDIGNLTNVYVSGLDISAHSVGNETPLNEPPASTLLGSGQVVVVQGMNKLELSKNFPELVPGFKAGLRSFIAIPLIFNDVVVGSLGLQSRRQNAYSNCDVQIARHAASQISGAIARARLISERIQAEESQRRLAEENAVIAEIGRIISSSADISEVYAQFGEIVSKLIPCDRISITTADFAAGEGQTAYVRGVEIDGRTRGYFSSKRFYHREGRPTTNRGSLRGGGGNRISP